MIEKLGPPIENTHLFFQGISNSMGMIDNGPRIGSNHTEALPLVEKTIYCAMKSISKVLLMLILPTFGLINSQGNTLS